jgi:hypothetical protein
VRILIKSVDHAPDDLERQTPFRGRLLRKIGARDRPGSWLAELNRPLSWTRDGVTHTIRHIVVVARWQGMVIAPGARLPVNIAYILDESLVHEESFDFSRAEFVAIGWAKISRRSLWKRLFGTPEADKPAAPR